MKEDISEWILNISMSRGNKNVIIKELNTLLLDGKINVETYYFSLYRELLSKNIFNWEFIAKEMYKLYSNNLINFINYLNKL